MTVFDQVDGWGVNRGGAPSGARALNHQQNQARYGIAGQCLAWSQLREPQGSSQRKSTTKWKDPIPEASPRVVDFGFNRSHLGAATGIIHRWTSARRRANRECRCRTMLPEWHLAWQRLRRCDHHLRWDRVRTTTAGRLSSRAGVAGGTSGSPSDSKVLTIFARVLGASGLMDTFAIC